MESWIENVYHNLKETGEKPVQFHFSKVQHLLPGHDKNYLNAGHKKFGPYQKVILAIPAVQQSPLWKEADKDLSRMLKEVEGRPMNTVYAAWDAKQIKGGGNGFFVSRKEKFASYGTYIVSHLFPHEAPKGRVITRSVLPGDLSMFSPEELIGIVLKDFQKVFGNPGAPLWHKAFCHDQAIARLDGASLGTLNPALSWQKNYPAIVAAGHETARPGMGGVLEHAYRLAREIAGL